MKIVFMGNNWVGWQILQWLKEQNETIEGVVIHPHVKQKFAREILEAGSLSGDRIFDGSKINEPETIDKIRQFSPDIGISVLFDYIFKKEIIDLFPGGIVNLHPAYLPYNRGQYPNVWSIIEETPSGVTLHYVDEGIDTGKIIARGKVVVEPIDTGMTLYKKLEQKSVELFKKTWPLIKTGNIQKIEQNLDNGTYHRTSDIKKIDEIHLDQHYKAKDIINILRARTFSPYKGAFFKVNGKKVYMRLELEYEDS